MNANEEHIPPGALVQCISPLRVIVTDRATMAASKWIEKGWAGVILRVREEPGWLATGYESPSELVALTKYDILWSTSAGGNLIGKNISHRFFTVML